jgi:hypothetical protein
MKRQSSAWFWIVIAATLWGAACRLYQLESFPPQAWVDEAWYNLRGRDLLQTGDFQVFYPTFWGGMHPLMVDLSALVQALGVHSLVASRGVAAVSGLLTVPLAFAAFNELWRREAWPAGRRRLTAALTALILSNLLYMVLASRIGYGPALLPPLMLIYVWQTRLAQRTGQWRGWLVGGAALGVVQYLNLNGRFLILLVVALALHDLATCPKPQRRPLVLGLGLAAGVSILIALPLILFFIREPQWLVARAKHITGWLGQAKTLLGNLWLIALSLNIRGDLNARQNLPARPILDILQSVGWLIGLVWVARNFRRSAAARALPLWVALMTVSSAITDDAPQFERMIGVGVPAAALVAVGWMEFWEYLKRRPVFATPTRQRVLQGAAAGMLLISLGLGACDFWVRYPHTPGLAEAFTTTPVNLARQLIQRASAETVYVDLISEAEDVYAFDYMFPGSQVQRLDLRQCLPLADRRRTRTTYLVLAERDQQSTANLQRAFPNANLQQIIPEAASLMGTVDLLEVPALTPLAPIFQPAHAQFAQGITLLGYTWNGPTVKAGESLFLTVYWKAEAAQSRDLTVLVHVGGRSPTEFLAAQHDGQPCQGSYPVSKWRVGDVIPDSFAIPLPANTPPGEYPLLVGWYEYPSLDRLPLLSADGALPDNRAVLAQLQVAAP